MKVLKKESLIYIDVDNTLVMHGRPNDREAIPFKSPYIDETYLLVPNDAHIRLLKLSHKKKRGVVVWSHQGAAWAARVVETLGLTEYVDLVLAKPDFYCDDMPIEQWHLTNIYLNNGWGSGASNGAKPKRIEEEYGGEKK